MHDFGTRRRWTPTIATGAAIAALATLITSVGATAAPHGVGAPAKRITLHLVRKDVTSSFVDNPPRQGQDAPPSIGDQITVSSELRTRAGAHAGTFSAICTATRGGTNARLLCSGLYSLARGDIAGMARTSYGTVTDVAIVGGTRAYAGVTGTALEISRDNSPLTDITLRLTYR